MNAVAIALGLTFASGVMLVLVGLRRRPIGASPAPGRPTRPAWTLPAPERLAPALGTGFVVLVVTRWPVIAAASAAAAWWLTRRDGQAASAEIERTEAIALWAEMLRDATGTARGIEGVLVTTAQTAPPAIRPAVTRFARRLSYEPIEVALPDLADDLDDPNGDLIVASLNLAATSGGRDLRAVLDDLAAAARDEARMRRRIEVSRQRPRSEMRQVVVIVAGVILALSIVGRSFLQPYGTVGGQIVLALAAGFWVGGCVQMSRLSQMPPVQRFIKKPEQA